MEGMAHHQIDTGTGEFSRDPSGLPMAEPKKDVVLNDGAAVPPRNRCHAAVDHGCARTFSSRSLSRPVLAVGKSSCGTRRSPSTSHRARRTKGVNDREVRGVTRPSVLRAWDSSIGVVGKAVASTSRAIGAGAAASAPGVIIDRLDPGFVRRRGQTLSATTTVVSGTNGKTTTAAMLATILDAVDMPTLTNPTGANLFRGVATALATASGLGMPASLPK